MGWPIFYREFKGDGEVIGIKEAHKIGCDGNTFLYCFIPIFTCKGYPFTHPIFGLGIILSIQRSFRISDFWYYLTLFEKIKTEFLGIFWVYNLRITESPSGVSADSPVGCATRVFSGCFSGGFQRFVWIYSTYRQSPWWFYPASTDWRSEFPKGSD